MEIRILGAHSIESKDFGCASLLIDDILAVDAGALTSHLSFQQQLKLKALLLTHQHYDHVRDVPLLGMTFYQNKASLEVYTTKPVYDALMKYLMDGELYPDFTKRPPEKPTFNFKFLEPGKAVTSAGYTIMPLTVNHEVPTVGYQITAYDGRKVFVSADTGPKLEDCWKQISPNLLVMETALPNSGEARALKVGHLTPFLLYRELESFRKIRGYLPKIVIYHLDPLVEDRIKSEIREVEKALSIHIRLSREGMKIKI